MYFYQFFAKFNLQMFTASKLLKTFPKFKVLKYKKIKSNKPRDSSNRSSYEIVMNITDYE